MGDNRIIVIILIPQSDLEKKFVEKIMDYSKRKNAKKIRRKSPSKHIILCGKGFCVRHRFTLDSRDSTLGGLKSLK